MKVISILIVFSLLLTGCGGEGLANGENGVTFTDDLGSTVTVESPKRVAAMLGSFAQIWLLAGGEVVAAPDDAWDDLKLELGEDVVNLGGAKSLSLELLLSAQPDFILASANTRQNLQWRETLQGTGIPTAYFDVADFEDYLRLLKICTDITGREDLYEQYGTAVQTQIDQVRERAKDRGTAPTVLCMTATSSGVHAKNSESNVMSAILKDLGCVNIADSDAMLLENVSLEHILLQDPDYIFFVQRGDDQQAMMDYVNSFLMEHPAWQQLTAVKNENVHFMDKNLYNLKPNHRWGEAYGILEEILENG